MDIRKLMILGVFMAVPAYGSTQDITIGSSALESFASGLIPPSDSAWYSPTAPGNGYPGDSLQFVGSGSSLINVTAGTHISNFDLGTIEWTVNPTYGGTNPADPDGNNNPQQDWKTFNFAINQAIALQVGNKTANLSLNGLLNSTYYTVLCILMRLRLGSVLMV